MSRAICLLAGAGLLVVTACSAPVGGKRKVAAQGPARTPPPSVAPTAPSAPADVGGDSPVSRLDVNADSVEASAMWEELADELAANLKTLSPGDYRRYIEQRAARWITDKIAELLLYQQASLRLPPETSERIDRYVEGEIRKIITAEYDGIQRRYEKHLAERGRTIDDVHARLRRQVIIASYLEEEVKPKVAEPTRAELLAAYRQATDAKRQPARRKMSLIDVRIVDHLPAGVDQPSREQSETARAAARAEIESAKAAVAAGEPFAEVARQHSDGLHAAEGGAWGWVGRDSVRERFEPAVDALYAMEEGRISDIIPAPDGFFLVRCDEVETHEPPSFEEMQTELKERYLQSAYNRLIGERVEELRQSARIAPANLNRFHAAVVQETLDRLKTNAP